MNNIEPIDGQTNVPDIIDNSTDDKIKEDDKWICPVCTFRNPINSPQCHTCLSSRPSDPVLEEGTIICPVCRFVNEKDAVFCFFCQSFLKEDAPVYEKVNFDYKKNENPEALPEGLFRSIYGATVQPNIGGVFFRVWSPNASIVYLIGDFNNWDEWSLAMYKPTPDSEYFELYVKEAKEGQSYQYQIVNQENFHFKRNDPRTPIIQGGRSVIYNQFEFEWADQNYHPPKWNEMVMYEIHVASFGASDPNANDGTFLKCTEKLDYLQDLGINAIEVMPISEDYHPVCWGYDPISLFAIHSRFGTPNDLKTFINEAHKRNIAVIIDWVPNHMSGQSVLKNFDGGNALGVYFYPDDRNKTEYGPRLDYGRPEVRKMLKDNALQWLVDFHFDGLRIDSTETMRNKQNPIIEAWTILQEVSDLAHALNPNKIVIAEDLQGNEHMNYVTGCDSQWDPQFFSVLYHSIICPDDKYRNLHNVANSLKMRFTNSAFNRVLYTENHDTIPCDRQNRIPLAVHKEPEGNFFGLKRSLLAAAILLTAPGIPMLLQGQEIYEILSKKWPEPVYMDWSRQTKYAQFRRSWKKLIKLRKNTDGLTKGLTASNIKITHLNDVAKVMVYYRFENGGAGDDVFIISNFSNRSFPTYQVGLPRPGRWHVRHNTDAKDLGYSGHGDVTSIMAEEKGYDGFFFSALMALGRYACVVLSQDPVHGNLNNQKQ